MCTASCRFVAADPSNGAACLDHYRCLDHGGRLHVCGAACTHRIVGDDAQVQCVLTGRSLRSAIAAHPHIAVARGTAMNVRAPPPAAEEDPVLRPLETHPGRRPRKATRLALVPPRPREVCYGCVYALLYGAARARLARELKMPVVPGGDPARASQVSDDVLAVWDYFVALPYCAEPPTSARDLVRFDDIVLGCLYLMRTGGLAWAADGDARLAPLASANPLLASMLPPIAKLDRLGFRVRRVTVGKNHLTRALRRRPYTAAAASSAVAKSGTVPMIRATSSGRIRVADSAANVPTAATSRST